MTKMNWGGERIIQEKKKERERKIIELKKKGTRNKESETRVGRVEETGTPSSCLE